MVLGLQLVSPSRIGYLSPSPGIALHILIYLFVQSVIFSAAASKTAFFSLRVLEAFLEQMTFASVLMRYDFCYKEFKSCLPSTIDTYEVSICAAFLYN